MEVTTFVEKEKESLIANPDEWKKKCEELGLGGQLDIVSAPESKPNPFLRMDKGLTRVFEELCPEKTLIEAFGKEPIPIEALGVYGLAVKEKYFAKVEVWYSPKESDPVIVGYSHDKNPELFLMARWGDTKESLEQLTEKAHKKWIAKSIVTLKKNIQRCNEQLSTIDSLAVEYFNGGWVNIY